MCMHSMIMILNPWLRLRSAGTSTDVSRYAGQYEHVFEATTAGVTLQAPQLDINTVAAGGGSRLFFRSVIERIGCIWSGRHMQNTNIFTRLPFSELQ